MDLALFRFINGTLANPVLDWLLPWFAWNPFFLPGAAVLAAGVIWRGGWRGRAFLAALALAIVFTDPLICNFLKEFVGRARPYAALEEVRLLVGRGRSGSFPSSHAANWFAATAVAFLFFKRAWWPVFGVALIVAFSRVYLGVHYPSDVLGGAVIGVMAGIGAVWLCERGWGMAGKYWFPAAWARAPGLGSRFAREEREVRTEGERVREFDETQWLRLGYVLIGLMLLARLAYLAAGKIELSEDEAYQWHWSQHLALSYYSKPPLIAYAQALGTALWGDTEFGIRFLSPVIGAILGLVLFRFLARERSAKAGVALVVMTAATPLLAVGGTLMTIDALSVLFWTLATVSGWSAVTGGRLRDWIWTGIWLGFGFLSKYTALFQLLCWAVFFAVQPEFRRRLKEPGPYAALGILALSAVPVLWWNIAHEWITVDHLSDRAGLSRGWRPTFRFFGDFIGSEIGLLNPVFFAGAAWASVAIWKRGRNGSALERYLFSMGAPLFLIYLAYTVRARVQPNWIAPSVLPLFTLAVLYWASGWQERSQWVKRAWPWGVGAGLVLVVLLHDTNLIGKAFGRPLPARIDPLRRVRGWSSMAELVEAKRREVEERSGTNTFVIGAHYGITSLVSFYSPGHRERVPENPWVFFRSEEKPVNQFWFWPGYSERKGQNALYVMKAKGADAPPARQAAEFREVVDLGTFEITYRGQVFHRIQLFECRDLL